MSNIFYSKTPLTFLKKFCVCIFAFFMPFAFGACQRKTDYFSYVSELRDNVFLGECEALSIRVFSLIKESPYLTDGIPCETNVRTEVYVNAPSADKACAISFSVGENTFSGEMSYDNVKGEYFYAEPVSSADLSSIEFSVTYGENTYTITANSVKESLTLTPKDALNIVVDAEPELFSSMTDKYGFTGEIYMRLIYEETPFYYVGVIERNGQVTALLLNANTGKIIAKRQP